MISLLELCVKVVFSEPLSVSLDSKLIHFFNSLLKKKLILSKVINEQLYFYLRSVKSVKSQKPKKSLAKFRSPVVPNVSWSSELDALQSRYNQLLILSKISQGNDENLNELIEKWKSCCLLLISDLRTLIGPVVIDQISRNLTLLELANSLKFDIKVIGDYDESNDEFY